MGYIQQRYLQQVSRHDINLMTCKIFTSVILYKNIIHIAQWLFDAKFFFKFHTVLVRLLKIRIRKARTAYILLRKIRNSQDQQKLEYSTAR